ncbi:TRAP transporter substrate-binding protein DctP [Alcaligenaceae bacterium]|nr:TRAP transporter substrate-binding protein DctP [Alcaligenaceae bacterium]
MLASSLFIALGLAGSQAAFAKEKMRVADSLPVGHFFAEYATKYWMEEVSKATNGEVTFDYYPAEQLGKAKDLLALTQSGVADVGYVVPSYASDKMPLTAVAELPGSFSDSCSATLAYEKLASDDGILVKKEFEPNGVRLMFALVMPPYQVFTGKKPLENVKSIAGLKLRTAGGAMDATVRKFDGVPVRMAAPDLYESLSRGTVDGMLFPYASLLSYDLAGITKYGTTGENFGSAVLTYVMSESRWKKLSPEVQKIMSEIGKKTTQRACSMTDKDTASDIEKIRAKGVTFVHFEGADRKIIDQNMQAVSQEWAKALDGRGKPGTDVLAAFHAALKAQ